jgi:choline dehydrogenase
LDAAPEIAPNYLSTEEDRLIAADSMRLTRRLMRQPALAQYHPEEFRPGLTVDDSDAALIHAADDIGTTIFHPVDTAKMGLTGDPSAVVDERLRVHGLQGLRVIDAMCHAHHHLGQHKYTHDHDRRQTPAWCLKTRSELIQC